MKYLNRYYSYIIVLFIFIIYVVTLAPSVTQIDTGELAAVQATSGIAHPTGYPLFTLIGYLFLKIPLPFTKIYQSNLLAAIYCTAALFFFIETMAILIDFSFVQQSETKEKKKKNQNRTRPIQIPSGTERIFFTAGAAIMLAFNTTFWQQSASTEVYSLQALLFSLILFFSIRFYTVEKPALKEYLLLSASVAFGFTNHMTTLLVIPGLIYLFFVKTGFTKETFRKIALMLIVFVGIVGIVYSYFFIRAAQNPSLNWGNPVNFENFLRHVSGKQYQVWMFSSIEDAKKQLVNYLAGLPSVFAYVPLIFSAMGIFRLFRLNRKLYAFFLITFLFSVLYTINYSIHDLESYFLLSYMVLTVFGVFGIAAIFQWIKERMAKPVLAYTSFIPVALIVLFLNFGKADSSGTYVYEDYCKAILNSVPQNSVVFSYQWDYFVASSYYFRLVENYRKDVTVIDKELLRRSWYFKQLGDNHPEVIKGLKPEINSFLDALKPFEQGKEFDSNTLEFYYQAIMTKLVSENLDSGGFFIGPELVEGEIRNGQFKLPAGTSLVPYGLLFKVVTGNEYIPGPDMNFKIRFPKDRDDYSNFIYNKTGTMLLSRALYELKFEKKDKAKEIVEKVRKEFPEITIPDQLK